MIRPFTLLCFCAFAGAGAWLYGVKHSVSELDRKLVEVRRETEQARQRIDILRAEWALMNEPERLRQTATRVLTLEGMQPQHFARPGDVERRLPAAVAFAGAPNIFEIGPAPRQADPNVMLAAATAQPSSVAAPAAA
ncbi:cell division protein FtsL, partial [Falsiroseomonas sp. HW251]|uniref:cell division protein FtsL n=1 Tax=Falsiroseomonas sp. HW251 TaxID=3390998 RepID=UPI003D31B6B1